MLTISSTAVNDVVKMLQFRKVVKRSLCIFTLIFTGASFIAAGPVDVVTGFPIVFPLLGSKLTSRFGVRKHPVLKYTRHHQGVDLAAPTNTPVRAVAGGVVIFADNYVGYGKLVTIQHDDGYTSLYGHLAKILIQPGQRILAGDIVGAVGKTGLATGPHLHFEWHYNNKPLDPVKVFPGFGENGQG